MTSASLALSPETTRGGQVAAVQDIQVVGLARDGRGPRRAKAPETALTDQPAMELEQLQASRGRVTIAMSPNRLRMD